MFGKSNKQAAEKARRGGTLSVIGADVTVNGDIATGDELRIDGRIEGDVRCAMLDQGEGGVIRGDVEADQARIAGTVEGRVSVRALTLEASARVSGDVSYESLAIAAGARIDGRFAHRDGPVAAETAPARPRRAKTAGGGDVAELFPQAAE